MSEKYNPEEYRVRCFKSEDYTQILQLWDLTGLGGAHRGDNLQIIQNTIDGGGIFFVLEHIPTQSIIGTAWITNDRRRLYLHHFGIHPEYQGKGLSHLLAKACIDFGKKVGLQMKLEVHKDNLIAKNLYKKYGFNLLGDYEVYIIRQY